MISKILEKVATRSAIRVVITLLVGVFVGIKFPEGVQVACSIADVMGVEVELCDDALMQ
jgi:hypothetical protein